MKKWIALILICATLLSLTGCSELAVTALEKGIDKLAQEGISLDVGKTLEKLKDMLGKLTDEQKAALGNSELLDSLIEEYDKLVEESIRKVEEQIAQLPEAMATQEGVEEKIEAARKAWELLPKDIRDQISNIDILEEAEKALEKQQ